MTVLPRGLVLSAGCLFAACLPLLAGPPRDEPKKAAKKAPPSKFIRVTRDAKNQPTALETATVRYVPASGDEDLVVDLIGVVHVGEKGYYQKLNKQFEQYDVLLYELVAPQGTRVPKGGGQRGGNPVAFLQNLMKNVLDLDSQVEHIDYQKENFVHADLSPDEMMKAIRDRGDDPLTLFLSVLADMMRQQNVQERQPAKNNDDEEPEVDFFQLLTDPHAAVKLKRVVAQQFESADDVAGLGSTLSTILVTDRNKAALKVLEKEIAKGRKKIGIFYGAAHMPDFEQRLKADFGLKRDSEQWLAAWNLKMEGKGKGGLLDFLKR